MSNRINRFIDEQAAHLLRTGQRLNAFEQIRQRHFWSTYLFQLQPNPQGVAQSYIQSGVYKVFMAVDGEQGQGWPVPLTGIETNWKSAGRVPDNQNFEILEIGVSMPIYEQNVFSGLAQNDPPSMQNPTPRNLNAFMQNTVVEIEYLTNRVSLGLANDFAQSAGPMMGSYQPNTPPPANPIQIEMTDGESRSFQTSGFAAPALRRKFEIPILLQHGETFSFNFNIERSFNVGDDPNDHINAGFPLRLDFWATETFVEKS